MLGSAYGLRLRQAAVLLAILGWAWGVPAAPPSSSSQSLSDIYQQAVASPIRTDGDRQADARRKPLEFLQFTKVQPGMQVMDVSAGGGYSTQLLALVVGKRGTVWAQTPELRPALKERMASHHQSNIIPVIRPFEDPVPAELPKLDLITLIWNYHDIAYMPVDRAKMNKRLFDALKPGGHLVVIDHAAKAGTGTNDAKTLHRIDEDVVMKELQQAGFRLEEEGSAFRNPADPRDEIIFKATVPVDNFALRFVKP